MKQDLENAENKIKGMEKEMTKLKTLVKCALKKPIFAYWDIRGLG
jgi:hypothetical protein